MRLIDANALPVKTDQLKQYVLYTAIEDAPTIDAVPVVLCCNCINCIDCDGVPYCTHWERNTDSDGYCHEGR